MNFFTLIFIPIFLASCSGSSASGNATDTLNMTITYYFLVQETDYSGADATEIKDADCNTIATVPADFAEALCTEGSGRLTDNRVVNFAEECACGSACSFRGTPVCFELLDENQFPWGMGSNDNALVPLRSLAADPDVLAYETIVYIADWDGVAIPAMDDIGGFVHDGCFRVDDVGFGITGNHFDFFAGTEAMFDTLEAIHDSEETMTVTLNHTDCDYLNQ